MKSHSLQKLLWITVATIICVPIAYAVDDWTPGTRTETPWSNLDASLDDAVSVLYLDNTCRVIALLSPDPADMSRYLPTTKKLLPRWYDRVVTNSVNCTTPIVFLPTVPKGGTAPAICDPNALVLGDDALAVGICQIVPMDVANLIALDAQQRPLLVLEGQSAANFARGRFPATILTRTRFTGACSPAIPSPCLAPKSGVIVKSGNVSVCRCQ